MQASANDQLISIQERNEALRELEQNIVDVNAIFKDLAVIVHEQGDMIGESFKKSTKINFTNFCIWFLDSIENNVVSAQMQVEDAGTQLREAVKHQVR